MLLMLILLAGPPATSTPTVGHYVVVLRDGTRLVSSQEPKYGGQFTILYNANGKGYPIPSGDISERETTAANRRTQPPAGLPSNTPAPSLSTIAGSLHVDAPTGEPKRQGTKNVSFEGIRQGGTTGGGRSGTAYSAITLMDCKAGDYKGTVDSAVARFGDEASVAVRTPRIALAAQISKMNEIKSGFASASVPACATEVRITALLWMDANLDSLKAFLGKEDLLSFVYGAGVDDAFRRYQAERSMLQ